MKARVWNDNVHPLTETFKGDKITIPAKECIEMEFFEAHEFKGQYKPRALLADESEDPASFKMVRIEKIEEAGPKASTGPAAHVCMACKHTSPSEEELEAHVKVRHAEASRLSKPELDESAKTKKKAG